MTYASIGLLIARLVFGLSISAHGAQKLLGWFGGYGLARTGGFFEQLGFAEMLKNPGLYDIKIRGDKGYIVGDIGNVLVTEDGGETWAKSLLPGEWRLAWIRGLSVLPSGEGMLVGASGLTFAVNGKEMRFSQVETPAH